MHVSRGQIMIIIQREIQQYYLLSVRSPVVMVLSAEYFSFQCNASCFEPFHRLLSYPYQFARLSWLNEKRDCERTSTDLYSPPPLLLPWFRQCIWLSIGSTRLPMRLPKIHKLLALVELPPLLAFGLL